MKIRYNLIFIPILIICAFAVWYLGFREQKQTAAKRLSDRSLVDPQQLQIIEITRNDETIRIEKAGSSNADNPESVAEWRMVSPYQAGCNPDKVSELLQDVMSAESERDFTDVTDTQLAEYGLTDPEINLRLISSSDSIMMDLAIGLANTSGTARYAMFSDSPTNVFLIPIYSIEPLEVTASDLRDIRALAFDKNDIVSVQISSSAGELKIDKENDSWMVTVPDRFPASPARLDVLFENILRLEASEFLPENADNPELAQTTVDINLKSGGGINYELTLHGEDIARGIFATSTWQPSPFLVEAYIHDRLALNPSEFIQTQLINIPPAQIARILVRQPGAQNLEIERTGAGQEDWRITIPPDRSYTEPGDFQAYIDSLLALQPEYIVPAPAHPGDYGVEPVYFLKIEVFQEGETSEAVIKLGSQDDNGNYYATQDDTSFFTISAEAVDKFIAAESRLKGTTD
jgi:hypothetical protein